MYRSVLVATALIAGLAATSFAESASPNLAGLKKVSAAQLERTLRGNTVVNVLADVVDWKVFYAADGAQRGISGAESDQGRWRVVATPKGAALCTTWSKWRPAEKCFLVRRNRADELVGFDGDTAAWAGRALPGNPMAY